MILGDPRLPPKCFGDDLIHACPPTPPGYEVVGPGQGKWALSLSLSLSLSM
jgi:hypothetical protein